MSLNKLRERERISNNVKLNLRTFYRCFTFVQCDPEDDILSMCERDEQTRPRFVLLVTRTIHSNRADYSLTCKKSSSHMLTDPSQQKYVFAVTRLCQPRRPRLPCWRRPVRKGCSTSSTALLCFGRPSKHSSPPPDSSHLPP